MFAEERLVKIKNILVEKKQIDVPTLSKMLSVSEVTVRRDLEKLEIDNFLTRTHGGAVLNEEINTVENYFLSNLDESYAEEKSIIGKIASCMINDNDTLILGPGSTCRHIAHHIRSKKNVRVVTSDIYVAVELAASPEMKIVLIGGDLDNSTLQLSGKYAEGMIKNFFVNTAFVEVDGVSLERGYTVDSIDKASIIREIMQISKEVIAVCDYTRFNNVYFTPLGPINMFNKVISNQLVPEKYKKYFFENNIKLFSTFDVYQGSV